MIRKALGNVLVGSTLFFASGCVYTSIKVPLDTNLEETRLGSKTGESEAQSILWLVSWGDSGTQAAAHNGGITTLMHADQKIFSVLFGLYSRQTTVVYGD